MGKVITSVVIDEQIQEYFNQQAINFSQFVRDAARQRINKGADFDMRSFRLEQVERRLEHIDKEREELQKEAEELQGKIQSVEEHNEKVGSFAAEIKRTSDEFSHYAPSKLRGVKPFQDRAMEYDMTVSELINEVVVYRKVANNE